MKLGSWRLSRLLCSPSLEILGDSVAIALIAYSPSSHVYFVVTVMMPHELI